MLQIKEWSDPIEFSLEEINNLFIQLNPSLLPITLNHVKELLANTNVICFVATDNTKLIGSASLPVFPIPTGIRCWIEDVVVDTKYRGQGIGIKLIEKCIEYAKSLGAGQIDLTSNPTRVAANELYVKMGFVRRETNVYRYVNG